MPTRGARSYKAGSAAPSFTWLEAGPNNIGGRTRALGVDVADPNRVIAGGVSGGIWVSEDRGASWTLVTPDAMNLSVTSLAQDPRPGFTDTWYYASGEFRGNSAADRGFRARYYGSGFYRSTDGGLTWDRLIDAGDETRFDTSFDYVARVVVSPTTGSVFVASNATGILRSTDRGETFEVVLGATNDHAWSDVVAGPNGRLLAVLSADGFNAEPATAPGVYVSEDDGATWTPLLTTELPEGHERSVLAIAPSTPDVAYLFGTTATSSDEEEDTFLFKLDLATQTFEDRSTNLPRFASDNFARLNTQGNYNLTLAVKPDNPNFVVLGTTNLHRSEDGFATSNFNNTNDWIGGYRQDNHHPDQHALIFDPVDPNVLWNGNDGGVYRTDDVTALQEVVWDDLNRGYNVTQFYTVDLPAAVGDARVAGGTQDNGTPFFRQSATGPANATDISFGDGAYLYFGASNMYVSRQFGSTDRLRYLAGTPSRIGAVTVDPPQVTQNDRLFIHPFAIDPTGETTMYYPGGDVMWRNATVNVDVTNWEVMPDFPDIGGRTITTLDVSGEAPSRRLYVGASPGFGDDATLPKLYRIDNADTTTSAPVDISIPNVAAGSYVHRIAVNPLDGDEVLVVHSNYNVVGLYHTRDAGATWTAVEGNLMGGVDTPGPSLRDAAILPYGSQTLYLVATSTGLYSTTTLEGFSTEWVREGDAMIGASVAQALDVRPEDGTVAVATHGRGIFVGSPAEGVATEDDPAVLPERLRLEGNYPNPFNPTTTLRFALPTAGPVRLQVYDVAGRLVRTLLDGEPRSAGRHEVRFDATGLASGTYLYALTWQNGNGVPQRATGQMLLLR